MKMRFSYFAVLATVTSFWFASCTKELSYETGNTPIIDTTNTSQGTLSGDPGSCANITVAGIYGQAILLDTSNKLTVEVNFTKTGTYYLTSDTVNGFYFNGSGSVAATGIANVTLKGNGTPLNPGQFTFKLKYKTSSCSFVVSVYQVATATTGDYFPTTTNSWWTYISNDPSATPADTAFQLSTGVTGTIPVTGQSYSLFTTAVPGAKDSSFYRKGSGLYYEFGDIDVTGSADLPVYGEYIFLKDNVAVGTEWYSPELSATVSGAAIKLRLHFVLSALNVNALLGNKIYTNTIKVAVTEQAQLSGTTWSDVISYQSWYAKGIGLVNVLAPAPAYGYSVLKYSVN